MTYSTRLSDAVHVLVLIRVNEGQGITSARIAESLGTNPVSVRKIMSDLRAAGLIVSARGSPKTSLSRDPSDISLLDVYRAVEGDKPLLHLGTHTNPECGDGVRIQLSLKDFYGRIQRVAESEMGGISLEDIITNAGAQEISEGLCR